MEQSMQEQMEGSEHHHEQILQELDELTDRRDGFFDGDEVDYTDRNYQSILERIEELKEKL